MDDVKVSLDLRSLDHTLGKRKLQAIDPNGTLVYDDGKNPEVKLTERLERIWTEYPNGMLEVKEETLALLPGESLAVDSKDEVQDEDTAARDPGAIMKWNEMEKLRSDVFLQMNDARNELWFALELVKTLALSTDYSSDVPLQPGQNPVNKNRKKPHKPDEAQTSLALQTMGTEPPVLPPGTYSTTSGTIPIKTLPQEIQELELALAAKQQALGECSALIDAAVEELQSMNAAGDRFWSDIRTLNGGKQSRKQWAIIAKPDFTGNMPAGERARDVIIPYAVDEAPLAVRSRSLAAFDLDPAKIDSLTFGARSHMRLRVTLSDGSNSTSSTLEEATSDESDIGDLMDIVQMEAFEEELYNQIRAEASNINFARMFKDAVVIQLGTQEITFEMYDPRAPTQDVTTSPTCDIILLAARLGLSAQHRQRKKRYLGPRTTAVPISTGILPPILQVLRYHETVRKVNATLHTFETLIAQIGLNSAVVERYSIAQLANTHSIIVQSDGTIDIDQLGGVISLEVEGCKGISLTAAPKSQLLITTTLSTFPIPELDSLSHIIAEQLSLQLLHWAFRYIGSEIEDEHIRKQIFVDELEECISAQGCGTLRLSIPPPFATIYATAETDDGEIDNYDSQAGINFRDWLSSFAARVVSGHA